MTTVTKKEENYTAEMVATMLAEYSGENRTRATVEMLATKLGRSVRSVTQKLVRLEVYQKESVAKEGAVKDKKESLADNIGSMLGLSEGDVTSLEKCNKRALAAILNALKFAQQEVGLNEESEGE